MDNSNWYSKLIKPSWAPPDWIFGPVWTILYIVIAVTFIKVFIMFGQRKLSFLIMLPFALNLFFNLLFTPIQFGLKNNMLASLDILLVLATLVWALLGIKPYMAWIAYVNIPYLLWVLFATVLQLTITFLNRK